MKLFLLLIIILVSPPSITMDNSISDSFIINNSQKMQLKNVTDFDSGAMLQTFYWLTPDNEDWWNMLSSKIEMFAEDGFNSLWLPPAVKTPGNNIARGGYEPFDFYDLGEFNQQGSIKTRYGSRIELENLIKLANDLEIKTIADIIINHRRGGELEYNPIASELYNEDIYTNTDFSNVASNKMKWDYSYFHPCETKIEDNYQFANFPDICHSNPNVISDLLEYANWLKNEIGFDGWRFDVAWGIEAFMLHKWMEEVGGLGVAEYWGGNYQNMTDYLDEAEDTITAFDFYLMYALRWFTESTGGYNMRELASQGLLNDGRAHQAITFVRNHDTVREPHVNIERNIHMAYAYILMHEGYPSVFWLDYFNPDLYPYIKAFLAIRAAFANGSTSILYNDGDVYIAQRNGDPGLIVAFNDHQTITKQITVQTKWANTNLYEQTGQNLGLVTDQNGEGIVMIPPMGYAIYAPHEPLFNIRAYPNRENFINPAEVQFGNFQLDAKLDLEYGYPVALDILGDAFLDQRDLGNIYLGHDNENLYIAFSYGKDIFKQEELTYGIALDTKEGGHFITPNFERLKYSFGGQPNFMFLLETDNTTIWNEVSQASSYTFNEEISEWKKFNSNIEYKSDAVFGFTEVKIPLNSLDLKNGGEIGVKVFSVTNENEYAYDSIPHDTSLRSSDQNSWMQMPERLLLKINAEETSVNLTEIETTEIETSENGTETRVNPLILTNYITTAVVLLITIGVYRLSKYRNIR
jgi:alpha-amylase